MANSLSLLRVDGPLFILKKDCNMKRVKRLTLGLCMTLGMAHAALAASVTNADVIKMLDASMPEEVVISAINSGQSKFDTSANALIRLKEKGASPAILNAVLNAGKTQSSAKAGNSGNSGNSGSKAASAKAGHSASGYNPEEVTLLVGGSETIMQYIIPQQRTAARAFGLGGIASYAALNGSTAQRRLTNPSPEFIVSVPKNAQAPNYLTLASFVVRKNGNREVSTGGGYMSYSSGIHKDRVVPIQSEALSDQSRAREGFVLYKIKPEAPLEKGEYALVLYTGELRTAGFFAQAANSYFDFGVD
jgi:hypothetical protein